MNCDLSPLILTEYEASFFNPLYLEMTENVIVLQDSNNFLSLILEKVRSKMKEWGSRKLSIAGIGKFKYKLGGFAQRYFNNTKLLEAKSVPTYCSAFLMHYPNSTILQVWLQAWYYT